MTHGVIDVEDNDHSDRGPSGAHKWVNCAASIGAEKGVPDVQTTFAASGTASHTLSQWCREQNVRAEKFRGAILRVGKFDNLVDADRVASVNSFCDYMAELGGHQFCELRVHYEEFVENGFGTMDGGAVVRSTFHCVDFKDGQGVVVEAENNEQLLLYCLGWYIDFGWLYPEVDTFVCHIVQPRVNHYVQSKPITLAVLLAWAADVIRPAALRTEDPDAPFNPGPWCSQNFCRVRGSCEARARFLLDAVVDSDFEDLDTAIARPVVAVSRLTNDEVAALLHKVPQLLKWASEIKAYAASELRQGIAVGDWKIVGGRSERRFTKSTGDVVAEVLVYMYDTGQDHITKKELFTEPAEPDLLSVAQLEKVIGRAAFDPGDPEKKKPPGALAHLVRKSPGRATVAPGTDPRPALAEEVLKEFENLDEPDDLD